MKISALYELIKKSENIVCINGRRLASDCGYPEYWTDEYFYYIEEKYGCSFEEIFNLGYFETRKDKFFRFYKDEVLNGKYMPSTAYFALANLEKSGKLKCIITKDMYNLEKRSGCKNVIDIYGNITDNICVKCGQRYSIDYVKSSKSIPCCLECGSVVRPGVKLTGELIDNNKITKAIEAISNADMLLILDEDYDGIFSKYIKYYKGHNAVMIKAEKKESDRHADYIIYDKPENVLEKLSDSMVHIIFDKRVAVNN